MQLQNGLRPLPLAVLQNSRSGSASSAPPSVPSNSGTVLYYCTKKCTKKGECQLCCGHINPVISSLQAPELTDPSAAVLYNGFKADTYALGKAFLLLVGDEYEKQAGVNPDALADMDQMFGMTLQPEPENRATSVEVMEFTRQKELEALERWREKEDKRLEEMVGGVHLTRVPLPAASQQNFSAPGGEEERRSPARRFLSFRTSWRPFWICCFRFCLLICDLLPSIWKRIRRVPGAGDDLKLWPELVHADRPVRRLCSLLRRKHGQSISHYQKH
jgi:hypothetical protein